MFLKNRYFLIGLLLILSLLWPLFAAPYFSHHDDMEIVRLQQMNKCVEDGQIPCRWVPDLGGKFGYPLFNYYAPLPYYFGELIYIITKSFILSFKFMIAIPIIFSYVFMYLFAKKYWGNLGGSLAAIFYSFAPYHALDIYVRGAMGEVWGFIFLPAILWSAERQFRETKILNMLFFAIFFAGLALTHNLSFMLFLPFLFLWIIFLFFKNKDYKFLIYFADSFFIGILLSSFYLMPMIFEKDLVHVETTTVGYFSYTEHFKGFKKLILERKWGYGDSIREVPGGEVEKISFQIGWVHIIGLILSLYTAKTLWQGNRWLSSFIFFSSSLVMFSIFMVNPRSQFIWDAIPPLKYVQFPWRFLILITFFTSFVSGSIFLNKTVEKWQKWIWLGAVILVVGLNFLYFKPEKFIYTTDEEQISGKIWEKQILRSIYDYLPIYAKEPPVDSTSERFEILTGESTIRDFRAGTNWFNFKVETSSHTILRLSQYYFPDWKIFIDKKETTLEYKNNSLGLMTIILGKGIHQIEGRLYDTPVRTIGNFASLAGLGLVIILFLAQSKNIQKWVSYYIKRIG